MGIIKRGIIKAQINKLNMYSLAEDVAEKMPQKKGRGDDVKRYFLKQGVKAEELEALGLNDLFRQERVTQREILDRIDSDRIEMEETVSTGPSYGSYDYGYDNEILDIEESYGPSHVEYEVEERLDDIILLKNVFLDRENIESYARRYSDDQDEFEELIARMEKVVNGGEALSALPDEIVFDLQDRAREFVYRDYDEDPVRRITVQVTDQNNEIQNIGDMPGAAFSYSLVGNENMGFGLDGLERDNVPGNIVREIERAGIYDPDEVIVRLRGIAEEYGDVEGLAQGETRWGEYTLDGGENYQEARLSLPSKGREKFREGIHFPDDINNVFHVRTKDREGPMGENILYVEEVQSDWAQQGRKQGFKNPEVEKQAQEAAMQLLEEVGPLLDELTVNPNVSDRLTGEKGLQASLTELLQAGKQDRLARINLSDSDLDTAEKTEFQRTFSLDAAGNIKTALQRADAQAKKAANSLLEEDYLDKLERERGRDGIMEMAADIAIEGEGDILSRILRDFSPLEEEEYIQNMRRGLRRDFEANINRAYEQVLKRAVELGELPPSGAVPVFDGTNPKFEAALSQAKEEQRKYLAGMGVDPMLLSKLKSALDKADPESAKLEAERMQRGNPKEGPFVLDTQSWNKLAIKYIFKKAAEEGYDGVSFAPADAHVDRWGDEGLRVQYEQNIPRAIDKVLGKLPVIPSNRPETMEVDGYESKIYHLDNLTRDGESIAEKMKDPTTMFGFAPLPLVLPQGIAGLQGLTPEKAAEQARYSMELDRGLQTANVPKAKGGIDSLTDALYGAGEVGYEALSDLLIEPLLGMAGAEYAFERGLTPEQAEAARARASALVDFETQTPTGRRYKEALKSGIGSIGEYLMDDTQSLDPVQFGFQKLLVPAGEAVTDAALGILSLDPRDTPEMEEVRREAARPVVEAIQPI